MFPFRWAIFTRHQRSENSPFITRFSSKRSIAHDYYYSDAGPLSKYSPVTLHLSPAPRILNDNPDEGALFISNKGRPGSKFSSVSQASLARKGLMTGLKVVKKSVNHL